MHLGLIDGPFVPHNLISTQESPAPLLKFQMAPNGLRVHERNPDILFFSLKSPGKRTSSRFPNRAPMKREARLQVILHISQKPHLSDSPVKEPSLKVPFMESIAERCPTTSAPLLSDSDCNASPVTSCILILVTALSPVQRLPGSLAVVKHKHCGVSSLSSGRGLYLRPLCPPANVIHIGMCVCGRPVALLHCNTSGY
jgi:hypothetical protein